MKPTQQEIIELAREAGFNDPVPSDGFMGLAYDKRDGSDTGGSLERLVHLALERFGAGGGEPVRYEFQSADGTWHPFIDARHYENTVADGRWPIRALYTHPSSSELRAAYYEGFMASGEGWNGEYPFQNGGKDPRRNRRWCQTRDNAIEALKGKQ